MSAAPAADHVLRMLTLLSHHPEPVSAGMVAATLRLPRSTTYRLLSILIDHGFVRYLPEERRYGLSVAAYELGSAYARQAPLQRIARPIVRQLVDRMKQNAHLAVLHGRDVLYVIEERAAGPPDADHRRRSAAACGAHRQRVGDVGAAAGSPGAGTVSQRGGFCRNRPGADDAHSASTTVERRPQSGICRRGRIGHHRSVVTGSGGA